MPAEDFLASREELGDMARLPVPMGHIRSVLLWRVIVFSGS